MEILFKNTYKQTEEWIREVNKYTFFRKPMTLLSHVLCSLLFVGGVYKAVAFNEIIYIYLFLPFFWFLMFLRIALTINNTQIKRMKEAQLLDKSVCTEVFQDEISYKNEKGAEYKIAYADIKFAIETPSYILIQTKARLVYSIYRYGFEVGHVDDFMAFLKDKGVKIK